MAPRAFGAKTLAEEKKAFFDRAALAKSGGDCESLERFEQEMLKQMPAASTEVLQDRDVALAVVAVQGAALQHFNAALRDDEDVVTQAVMNDPFCFPSASERLQNNKGFVLGLVQHSPRLLIWVRPHFQSDRDVVLEAVRASGYQLVNSSLELRNDREIVLEALRTSLGAIQHASPELKQDRNFILEAVRRRGKALQFASEMLRDDKEIVLAAVTSDHQAFHDASLKLRLDEDFVLLAARSLGDDRRGTPFLKEAALTFKQRGSPLKLTNLVEAFGTALAAPGQVAPILSVFLIAESFGFRAEVSLLSGACFECSLQRCDGFEPTLQDLAAKLVEELPKHMEAVQAKHVFITFLNSDGESFPTTIWQGAFPLKDFVQA